MTVSAVIIASGRATRLGDICKYKPKCLVPFEGVPFLRFLVFWLLNNGITDIVVTGSNESHAELIEKEIKDNFPASVRLVIEEYPRSTTWSTFVGVSKVKSEHTLLLTADNVWNLNLRHFIDTHLIRGADCSVLATSKKNVPNFGKVKLDNRSSRIISMWDPECVLPGTPVSTMGFYALRKQAFLEAVDLESDLYVERETMQKLLPNAWGVVNNKFFTDFGTPEGLRQLTKRSSLITKYFGKPISGRLS
ncbi:MAG: NDP-sugar synthase [Candidatus Moranbacteria bacterium]|nr:NDP-sugar synthase [Candidatus Moranbacteria bacterium]